MVIGFCDTSEGGGDNMKLLIVADSHTIKSKDIQYIRNMRKDICDGVLFLGDIQEPVLELICNQFPEQFKLGVLGNHDTYGMFNRLPIEDLHKKVIVKEDVSFAGFEGSLRYKNSYYPAYHQEEVEEYLNDLEQVDILISHNSPYGINERPDRQYEGFKAIEKYLEERNPVYHFN